jgi:hypothetical protein
MNDPIRPGQVATCSECGAKSEPAYTTRPERYKPREALIVEWRNGARPQFVAALVLPTLCVACVDRKRGTPPAKPETPQETFARLAGEFERETGFWAPGRLRASDETDGLTEAERQQKWVAWLTERNRANRPSPAPRPKKGQIALF